tara:strand:+ start:688 stop:921 length:234 start_codon:yes stop_codon:yes gene_type:complete
MNLKEIGLVDYMNYQFPSGLYFYDEAERAFGETGITNWLYDGERWLDAWVQDNAPAGHEMFIEKRIMDWFKLAGVVR